MGLKFNDLKIIQFKYQRYAIWKNIKTVNMLLPKRLFVTVDVLEYQ